MIAAVVCNYWIELPADCRGIDQERLSCGNSVDEHAAKNSLQRTVFTQAVPHNELAVSQRGNFWRILSAVPIRVNDRRSVSARPIRSKISGEYIPTIVIDGCPLCPNDC